MAQPPAPSQHRALTLPPPQIFDILPALHELLARIEHTDSLADGTSEEGNETGVRYSNLQPLEPKDLPTEVLAIKSKIRVALRVLGELPDMDRSVEEQGVEIGELEERVRRQRGVLRGLGVFAGGAQREGAVK